MTQGKREDQIKFSSRMVFISIIGIIILMIVIVSKFI